MRVRALTLRLHLVVGVLTGGALLVLGLSGAVLVLRPELDGARLFYVAGGLASVGLALSGYALALARSRAGPRLAQSASRDYTGR